MGDPLARREICSLALGRLYYKVIYEGVFCGICYLLFAIVWEQWEISYPLCMAKHLVSGAESWLSRNFYNRKTQRVSCEILLNLEVLFLRCL